MEIQKDLVSMEKSQNSIEQFDCETVSNYFKGGNVVGGEIIHSPEKYLVEQQIQYQVDYNLIVQKLSSYGYFFEDDVIYFLNAGEPKALVSLRDLVSDPGHLFFHTNVNRLVKNLADKSPLNLKFASFSEHQWLVYLSQLRETIKTTPFCFIAALTQPIVAKQESETTLKLLSRQIRGILLDELGATEFNQDDQDSQIDLPDGTLFLDSRKREEDLSKLVYFTPTEGQHSKWLTVSDRTSWNTILNSSGKSHYTDFIQSLNSLFGETWKQVDVFQETINHCNNCLLWFSGNRFNALEARISCIDLAFWLIAATIEVRFAERVKIITENISKLFQEQWMGEEHKFWYLHGLDNEPQGHANLLIRNLGMVFPPPTIAPDLSTQLSICLKRLYAVEVTQLYFDQVLTFDKYMVGRLT